MKVNKDKVEMVMAQNGLNQTKLSNLMGISRTRLSSIINGKNCRPCTINKLITALKVDVTEIIEN